MKSSPGPCEVLAWDTEFWGFRVGRVRGHVLSEELMGGVDAWCRAEHVRCLYLLAAADHFESTRLAESSGFRLVDVRMTYARASEPGGPADGIRAAAPEDIPALREIARGSYQDSRFYVDPCFPRQRADELYAIWIEKSCRGYAETVLVADAGHTIDGYITCHLDVERQSGSIGLVGVRAEARGRGVARTLLASALGWFAEHAAEQVSVVTQARNRAAQRTYERAGFLIDEVALWFHRWHSATGVPTDRC